MYVHNSSDVYSLLHTRATIPNTPYPRNAARVPLTCTCCGETKVVSTEEFRLNYVCDKCKESPVLIRSMANFLYTSLMKK